MKKTIAMLTAAALTLSMSFTAFAASGYWKQDAVGKWYQHMDGSYPVNAWEKIEGKWYCFDGSGYMMKNQWAGDYYLGADGVMLVNTVTPDGYVVDQNGKWVPGERYEMPEQAHSVNKYDAALIAMLTDGLDDYSKSLMTFEPGVFDGDQYRMNVRWYTGAHSTVSIDMGSHEVIQEYTGHEFMTLPKTPAEHLGSIDPYLK